MASEEGRARFLSQARPLVAQIEAPALGAMLRKRLAETARLAPDEIERLIPTRPAERRQGPPPRTSRSVVALPESRLLARLLVRPDLVAQVPDDALRGIGPESAALRAVMAFFKVNP